MARDLNHPCEPPRLRNDVIRMHMSLGESFDQHLVRSRTQRKKRCAHIMCCLPQFRNLRLSIPASRPGPTNQNAKDAPAQSKRQSKSVTTECAYGPMQVERAKRGAKSHQCWVVRFNKPRPVNISGPG